MNDLLRIADAAASKNDRWLFVIVLIVLGAVVLFAVRWLLAKLDALQSEHRTDQQSYTNKLEILVHQGNDINKTLAVSLERNSCALESNTEVLQQCTNELKRRNVRT